MSEVQKEPGIKLFGKTIQLLLPDHDPSNDHDEERRHTSISLHKKPSQEIQREDKGEDTSSHPCADESIDPPISSALNEDPKTPNTDKEISSTNNLKSNRDPNETINSDEKTELKKPDKILPCPRCNSMGTKFCYFSNYNANQPRHFCKNCQRYWTAGGTMRNVPVGSGRRKNKSSFVSHYKQIIVSDPIHHHSVLTFGSDAPLCDSMASVLNLAEKSLNGTVNEFHQKNGDDGLAVSSSGDSNLTGKGENDNLKNFQGYPCQVECFPAPHWPYPWNSAQYRPPMAPSTPTAFGPSNFPVPFYPPPQYWGCTVPSGSWSMPWLTPEQSVGPSSPSSPLGKHSRDGNMLTSSWNSAQYRPPMAPSTPTAFGPSNFPVPFYPPPQYWGCTVPSGSWSMPWLTPEQSVGQSSPSSPLGKHSRDGNMLTSSWNSAQYRPPMAPSTPTAFGPSNFPVPFYPPPQYWGCTVPSGSWSMPWLTPEQSVGPSSPSSPLGKHSRDGNMLTSSNSAVEQTSERKDQETAVLIPKTLRINDPNEAAKSSIWSTLGIKNDDSNSIKGGSLSFMAFEPKGDQKNHFDEESTVLHANPAALSRSRNFHESS